MKKKADFRALMFKDLLRIYREVCQSGDFATCTECYDAVVRHLAPRFYIDPRFAHTVISPMLRGDRSKLEIMKPLTRQMYEDLFDVVVRLSQLRQFHGKTLNYILQYAVLEPAPRFYISPTRMGQIWLAEKRKLYHNTAFKKLTRKRKPKDNDEKISESTCCTGADTLLGVHSHCGVQQ